MSFPGPMFAPVAKLFKMTATNPTSTGTTTQTMSGVSFGHPALRRLIIVAIAGSNNTGSTTVLSATIGGVAASIAVQATSGGNSNNPFTAIIYAVVPTGETGDIVVVLSRNPNSFHSVVYRSSDISSTTPHDTASDVTGADSLSVDIPTGGGFAIASCTADGSPTNLTWTGLTERHEATENSLRHEIADTAAIVAAAAPRTISADAGTNNATSCCASWG